MKDTFAKSNGNCKDYMGKKYGVLTATKPTSKRRNGCIIWEFLCECGNTIERLPAYLKGRLETGNIPSCGCHRKRDFLCKGMTKDYTLQKYGMIILTTPTSKVRGRYVVWEGICECGKLVERTPRNLEATIRLDYIPNCGCKNRLPKYNRAKNRILYDYKRRAEKKGIEFRLTDDEAFALFDGNCHYCNASPSSNTKIWNRNGSNLREVYLYNGIDRINNDEGYNPQNCVPCCGRCNFGKGDSGADEFLQRIIKIYNHLFEDG